MKLILSGFLLVTTGAVLPFLMVLRMLEASFPLSLLSYAASLSGLALGMGLLVSCASGRYPGHHHGDAPSTGRTGSRIIRRGARALALSVSESAPSGNVVRSPRGPSLR